MFPNFQTQRQKYLSIFHFGAFFIFLGFMIIACNDATFRLNVLGDAVGIVVWMAAASFTIVFGAHGLKKFKAEDAGKTKRLGKLTYELGPSNHGCRSFSCIYLYITS